MAEARYASMNAGVSQPTSSAEGRLDLNFQPSPATTASRSISIFSRRGTESPDPRPPFIAQGTIEEVQAQPCRRRMSERQKGWLGRRRSVMSSSSRQCVPTSPGGTILNAVPPAEAISPTDETGSAVTEKAGAGGTSDPVSPVSVHLPFSSNTEPGKKNLDGKAQRTRSGSKRAANSRIGVWANGVTQWDDLLQSQDPHESHDTWVEEVVKGELGFAPLQPRAPSTATSHGHGQHRPFLSVHIPISDGPLIAPGGIRSTTLCKAGRAVVPIAPARIASRFGIPSKAPMNARAPDVPLIAPVNSVQHSPAVYAHKESLHPPAASGPDMDCSCDSASATSLSDIELETGSDENSKRSSTTSVDALPVPIPKRSSKRLSGRQLSSFRSSRVYPQPSDSAAEDSSLSQKAVKASALSDRSATDTPVSEAFHDAHDFVPAAEEEVQQAPEVPERPPTLPRRSRKREWKTSAPPPTDVGGKSTDLPSRTRSETGLHAKYDAQEIAHSVGIRRFLSTSHRSQLDQRWNHQDRNATSPLHTEDQGRPSRTEAVHSNLSNAAAVIFDAKAETDRLVLHIMGVTGSFDDLRSLAGVNRSTYAVYKANEMHLIEAVLMASSPAAWEFRKWCPRLDVAAEGRSAASTQLEHTPESYLRALETDKAVIQSLKDLVLAHCQTSIRHETAFALSGTSHSKSQALEDAFWRVWCFCKIFGGEKGRDDDVTGQLDWLKGGLLANGQDCEATVNTNLNFEMSSVLLNPPEFFAKGNAKGLNAQELYDVIEVWSSLHTLLERYHGQIDGAREAGIFDDCVCLTSGDALEEQLLLEEWVAYLLTRGLDVVVEMARHATTDIPKGFAVAKANGWTRWSPLPYDGSRTTFLREPLTRLYEERVAADCATPQHISDREQNELTRKRMATLAAEIRLTRRASTYKRSSHAELHSQRTMSMISRSYSTMSRTSSCSSPRTLVSPMVPATPCWQSTDPVSPMTAAPYTARAAPHLSSAGNFPLPRYTSPIIDPLPRYISPIIEGRVQSFNRLSLQNALAGEAEDTSDKAVRRIVDMGFTPAEAKHALKKTDMGDGIRIDRAVDYLLRQRR